jgi:hypothetical protein
VAGLAVRRFGREGQQEQAGGDVHEVVPAVHLEAEEAVALETCVAGVEVRVRDEPEHAYGE